jgi:restriction system protein
MGIPDYQAIMLPLMELAGNGKEFHHREASEQLVKQFSLKEEERKALLPSGQQHIFDNRVGWAITYLKKAGLLERTRRGYFRVTPRGLKVLQDKPTAINVAFLRQFPEFIEFQAIKRDKGDRAGQEEEKELDTPEEAIESAYQKLRKNLISELIQMVKKVSPSYFEKLVVDLLLKMGYGGTRKDAGEAIGKSGDEGIDGIIKEDRLGLDVVYVQAKRWESPASRPEIQKFAGALQGQRARKGIFITTSSFTKDAADYASRIESKIVLIDGDALANLMIDHGVGVATAASYEIRRIDQDYFIED